MIASPNSEAWKPGVRGVVVSYEAGVWCVEERIWGRGRGIRMAVRRKVFQR
jgi:hypothetical protein